MVTDFHTLEMLLEQRAQFIRRVRDEYDRKIRAQRAAQRAKVLSPYDRTYSPQSLYHSAPVV